MNPGIYYDLPDADYRKARGVSYSALKKARECGFHMTRTRALLRRPVPPTEAMMFGRAFHQALLLPHEPPCWRVMPDGMTARQNAGKAWIEETVAAGLCPLSQDHGKRLAASVKAFQEHPLAAEIMQPGGKAEVSCFAPFSLGGEVMRKGRLDWVSAGTTIVDFKTAGDASPGCVGKRDAFASQLYDLDYDMQAAYYLDLWNGAVAEKEQRREHFAFVVLDWCEDSETVGIRVLNCTDEVIRSGRDKYTEALTKWIECEASGQWPGYSASVEPLRLPEWARRRYGLLTA